MALTTCSLSYSLFLRTSKINCFFSLINFSNSLALTSSTESIGFPSFLQTLIPPFRYPSVLSKPTLESLVTVSSSLPSGVINRIGWGYATKITPQGENYASFMTYDAFDSMSNLMKHLSGEGAAIKSLDLDKLERIDWESRYVLEIVSSTSSN